MKFHPSLCVALSIIKISTVQAQHSQPDTIKANYTKAKIEFDGKLDEPEWQLANRISNFTQRELFFGQPVTERTETAIIYDQLAMHAIYQLCFHDQT